jgi:hypothetical protein
MKRIISKSVLGAMAVILTAQTTPNSGLLISSANAQDLKLHVASSTVSKVSEIKIAYSQFKKNIDLKLKPTDKAISDFTESLVHQNITVEDIGLFLENYTSSDSAYENYLQSVQEMKSGLNGEKLSQEEFSFLVVNTFDLLSPEALNWSGCTGASIGGVLILSAFVYAVANNLAVRGDRDDQAVQEELSRQNKEKLKALVIGAVGAYFVYDGVQDC